MVVLKARSRSSVARAGTDALLLKLLVLFIGAVTVRNFGTKVANQNIFKTMHGSMSRTFNRTMTGFMSSSMSGSMAKFMNESICRSSTPGGNNKPIFPPLITLNHNDEFPDKVLTTTLASDKDNSDQVTSVFLVYNSYVNPGYVSNMHTYLGQHFNVAVHDIVLAFTENSNNNSSVSNHSSTNTLYNAMVVIDEVIRVGGDGNIVMVAVGDNECSDLVGFAASLLSQQQQRQGGGEKAGGGGDNVRYLHIPTSITSLLNHSPRRHLSIHHTHKRNALAVQHASTAILLDPLLLSSITPTELSQGLFEIIKYAMLKDGDFFVWLDNNMESLLNGDLDMLSAAVVRAHRLRRVLSASDDDEAALNSIGNNNDSSSRVVSGDCLAVAMDFSQRLGFVSASMTQQVISLLQRVQQPIRVEQAQQQQQHSNNNNNNNDSSTCPSVFDCFPGLDNSHHNHNNKNSKGRGVALVQGRLGHFQWVDAESLVDLQTNLCSSPLL